MLVWSNRSLYDLLVFSMFFYQPYMRQTQDFIRTTFARTYKEEGNEQQFHVLPHHFLAAAAAELIRFVGF